MHEYNRSEIVHTKSVVCTVQKTITRIVCMAFLVILIFPSIVCLAAKDGELVNVVPFGELKRWDSQGIDYGVIFEDARDIFRVVVRFADSKNLPAPESVRLQYWQSSWPHRRIPRYARDSTNQTGSGASRDEIRT